MDPKQRSRDVELAVAFGQRVQQLRKAAGLTQEQLAERAGLHPTFISNVERAYRVPSVPTLLRLASALQVRPGAIVDDLDPP